MENNYRLVYVTDAYCGWCYGIKNELLTFHNNNPEVAVDVIAGGLFIEGRSLPIRSYGHIGEANKRISQVSGAVFGEAYEALLTEGSFVLNSEDAAIGQAALRSVDPENGLAHISAMQHAFYHEGKSLSDPNTYVEIAAALNLDAAAVKEALVAKETRDRALQDFAKTRSLGVDGFPTVLLQRGDSFVKLGDSTLTSADIESKIKALTTVHNF